MPLVGGLEDGGDALLRLDCTKLSAEETATAILTWSAVNSGPRRPATAS